MKIGIDIHTIGAHQTGNETYIKNIVSNLDCKHELYLYHTKTNRKDLPDWNANYRKITPHSSLLRIPFLFPLALKKDKIDVAHFQYVVPPISPCPTVVMIHDISYEFFPEFFHPLSRKRMQILIPFSARKSEHVLTVSEYSKKQIVEKYGIPEDKITVTYNGVSDSFRIINDQNNIDCMLQRLTLKKPFILAVGNLQARKNIERLVRVYAKLRKSGKIEHDLVLVGKADYKGHKILEIIEKNNIKEHVKLTGYVNEEELVALYNQADVFVYPSLYEGFGLPLIESMACGTPVITSNVSSLPEVAGGAALYIDPESDQDLESQLLKLLLNTELQKSLIDKGLIQIQKFSWKKAASLTSQIFEKIA